MTRSPKFRPRKEPRTGNRSVARLRVHPDAAHQVIYAPRGHCPLAFIGQRFVLSPRGFEKPQNLGYIGNKIQNSRGKSCKTRQGSIKYILPAPLTYTSARKCCVTLHAHPSILVFLFSQAHQAHQVRFVPNSRRYFLIL